MSRTASRALRWRRTVVAGITALMAVAGVLVTNVGPAAAWTDNIQYQTWAFGGCSWGIGGHESIPPFGTTVPAVHLDIFSLGSGPGVNGVACSKIYFAGSAVNINTGQVVWFDNPNNTPGTGCDMQDPNLPDHCDQVKAFPDNKHTIDWDNLGSPSPSITYANGWRYFGRYFLIHAWDSGTQQWYLRCWQQTVFDANPVELTPNCQGKPWDITTNDGGGA